MPVRVAQTRNIYCKITRQKFGLREKHKEEVEKTYKIA